MKTVFATFRQAGMHHWPDAPEQHAYLRVPHRHMFHVRVDVAVGGLNRDVEFILLKHHAEQAFLDISDNETSYGMPVFGARSCEMLAADLKALMDRCTNGYNIVAIEISEDGENGARLTWPENLNERN